MLAVMDPSSAGLLSGKMTDRHGLALASGLYVLLLMLVFGDVFLAGGRMVLSEPRAETWRVCTHWRDLGFRELRHGHLVLWNPHTACGTPFFGAFQTSLLYPINWIHLVLPLGVALNLEIVLNLLIGALSMYAWAAHKRMGFLPSFICGALFMFSGAFYQHLYPGHLPQLAVMAWAPLLFLMVDILLERSSWQGVLPAIAVLSVMILGGFPQYVFYALLAVGLYVLLRLPWCQQKAGAVRRLAAMAAGALAVTAIQWMTAVQACQETSRSGGVPYAFASTFSFPPENLLTLLSPAVFGGDSSLPYWGRWYLWEMCLFIGVTGFFLLVTGTVLTHRTRERNTALVMAAALFVMALGAYTPLFRFLYDFVPGFDLFRSNGRFILPLTLFLILLAGYGLEALMRREPTRPAMALLALVGGSLCLIAGWTVSFAAVQDRAWWQAAVAAIGRNEQSYLDPGLYRDAPFARLAAGNTAQALLGAGLVLCVIAGLLALAWRRRLAMRTAAVLLCALAAAELVHAARQFRPVFPLDSAFMPEIAAYLQKQPPGDYRILNPLVPDAAIRNGAYDVWGGDPSIVRRYAEFMFFTQGENPDNASEYFPTKSLHPLLGMVRCRYAFLPQPDKKMQVVECSERPLPRFLLVNDWRLAGGRNEIFQLLAKPDFDPSRQVILETAPSPAPSSAGAVPPEGEIAVLRETTDSVELTVKLKQPAILVVTDNYTPAWRVFAFPDSTQQHYGLQPANYILRAVPLGEGFHHLRMEYRPRAFVIGAWVSGLSLAAVLAWAGWCVRTAGRRSTPVPAPVNA